MTHYDIVKKLIGQIKPIGETTEDNKRFENLSQFCELLMQMLYDIDDIAFEGKDRHEHSVKRASEFCSNFIKVMYKEFLSPDEQVK